MKVVILAGGFGTRIAEFSKDLPKPMVEIGNKPILWHIMNHYARFKHKDFYLALGYKSNVIKEYFLKFNSLNSDLSLDLQNQKVDFLNKEKIDWKVNAIQTGIETMTGGRLKRLKPYLQETFMLTYGDALSNIDIDELLEFHQSHGKMVTVSAVHPSARFGELSIEDNKVLSFKEKPQTRKDWINGGFFIIEPEFIEFIENDETVLESSPLEEVAKLGELMAYKHEGFWQCMDTKRDFDRLESLWLDGSRPWENLSK
ncbi:MAG: glucose-1-phosphate cytidylyltransferase [Gammaproteobacteria bacterium]|mgnify:FL=1|nr:MAG: glucose-1-phosphate cytidylyltransferase [Gammaproteobacteria bacterium]